MYIVSVEKITLLVRHILHSKNNSKEPQKSQEEKTSKQEQNMHPFSEIKAINSVFLLEIAGIRIDYCTPLKKNMQEAKTKLKQIFSTYKSKRYFPPKIITTCTVKCMKCTQFSLSNQYPIGKEL